MEQPSFMKKCQKKLFPSVIPLQHDQQISHMDSVLFSWVWMRRCWKTMWQNTLLAFWTCGVKGDSARESFHKKCAAFVSCRQTNAETDKSSQKRHTGSTGMWGTRQLRRQTAKGSITHIHCAAAAEIILIMPAKFFTLLIFSKVNYTSQSTNIPGSNHQTCDIFLS